MRRASAPGLFGTGDVPVRSASGRRVVLRMGFRAFLAFEAETGRPVMPVIHALESGRLESGTDLVQLLRAAAQQHQPGFTLEEAADVLDAQPECVMRLLRIASPDPVDHPDDVKKKTRPGLTSWRFWRRGSRPV